MTTRTTADLTAVPSVNNNVTSGIRILASTICITLISWRGKRINSCWRFMTVKWNQGRSEDFHSEGYPHPFPFPPSCFLPLPSSLSPFLPSLPSPPPFAISYLPIPSLLSLLPFLLPFLLPSSIIQLGGLGSAVSSPSGSGRSQADKRFLANL